MTAKRIWITSAKSFPGFGSGQTMDGTSAEDSPMGCGRGGDQPPRPTVRPDGPAGNEGNRDAIRFGMAEVAPLPSERAAPNLVC